MPPELEVNVASSLFPQLPEVVWPLLCSDPHSEAHLISKDELLLTASRLPSGKAPGPNNVSNEVVAALARVNPNILLKLFNACLVSGVFPDKWKSAKLVLLHMGKDKPTNEPSSFRLISLLDGIDKLFE